MKVLCYATVEPLGKLFKIYQHSYMGIRGHESLTIICTSHKFY